MLLRTKKLLTAIITVCFAAALVAFGVSLFAPETQAARAETTRYCVRIENNGGGVSEYPFDTFEEAWTKATGVGVGETPTVILNTDTTVNSTVNVASGKNITLDLNGHMLALKEGASGSVISVKSGSTFTLTDTNTDKSKMHLVDNPTTTDDTTDTVEISGGVITGGKGGKGGGVYIIDGTFNMSGGTIAGNTADAGGGVYMNDSGNQIGNRGVINMSGNAAIKYNSAGKGGGVFIWGSLGKFNFSGGSIDHNSAYGTATNEGGGGVYVTNGTFGMTGGTISDNSAGDYGGGVFVLYEKFIMSDGTISGNKANNGGGVHIYDGAFTMSDGTISGNVAAMVGGGVDVRKTFEMSGGTISGNTANNGGGVYNNGTFKAEKLSTIRNNTANVRGGGVFNNSTFEIKDAVSVSGNKNVAGESAKTDNVYLSTGKKITVTGKLVWDAYNAAIGVNVLIQYSGAFTTGYGANNKFGDGTTVDPNNYFTADGACLTESEGEVEIGNHNYVNGVCTRCGDEAPFEVTAGGVKTYYHTIGEAWDAANTAGTATVKMFAEATAGETLTVAAGKDITLDLNGQKLTFTNTSGRSITVNGKFTLKDSDVTAVNTAISAVDKKEVTVYGGVITRGETGSNGGISVSGSGATFNMRKGTVIGFAMLQGGGVSVGSGAKFHMYSGAAVKGCKSSQDGGGVYISGSSSLLDLGQLFMNGGEISDNAAGGSGGGVYAVGLFTMHGTCTISGNTAGGSGGGVFAAKGTSFFLGGCPVITGNKKNGAANNVFLDTNALIDMVGEMSVPAQIYVNNTGNVIRRYTQNSESPSEFFRADDSSYNCVYVSDQTTGTVCIGTHNYVNGVCANCGAKAQIYWCVSADGTTLTVSSAEITGVADPKREGSFDYDRVSSESPWRNIERSDITTVNVTSGVAPVCTAYWFYDYPNLSTIDLSGLDTSNVTDMSAMFYGCTSLTSLDLSGFDTSNVTDMMQMFCACEKLKTILLSSSFNTSNVEDMNYMFWDCESLTSLDLSVFDTVKVTDMHFMFNDCRELKELDLSSFDMSNVSNTANMLGGCNKLRTIKIPKVMGAASTDLPAEFWNGTAPVTKMTSADAGKTLIWHGDHTYGWVTASKPTCTEKGSEKEVCFCGHESGVTRETDALGHNWGGIGAKPVWTWNGYNEVKATFKCKNEGCDEVYEKTVYSTGTGFYDKIVASTQKEATCTDSGIIKYQASVEFNNVAYFNAKYETVSPKAHTYGEWNAGVAATCTETGKAGYYVCSECGYYYDKNNKRITDLNIPALGHDEVSHAAQAPTCTEKGWNEYVTCSRCDYATYSEIDALGHDIVHCDAKAATCTEKGWNAYEVCTRCDHSTKVETDALGHSWGEWTVSAAATCTEKGEEIRVCAHNGAHTETREISAKGHSEVADAAVAPTCTESGKSAGSHCSVCNTVLTPQTDIPALGHDWGEWTLSKAATVDEFGEEKRVCSHDGTHVETRQLPKRILQLVKPDENGGEDKVVVTLPEGFAPDIQLVVTEIKNYGAYEAIAQSVNGEVGFVYDVTLKVNGVTVQPDGTLTIKLLIPTHLQGKNFKLFHMHGSEATEMNYDVDGSYAVVTADKLSEFVFVGEKVEDKPFNPLWLILIIIVSLVIVGEVGFIVYRKVFKNKPSEGKE